MGSGRWGCCTRGCPKSDGGSYKSRCAKVEQSLVVCSDLRKAGYMIYLQGIVGRSIGEQGYKSMIQVDEAKVVEYRNLPSF